MVGASYDAGRGRAGVDVGVIVALLAGILCLYWWHSSVDCRELANRAAFAACAAEGLWLLDGTVSFRGWRAGRDNHGRLRLRRHYVFDYSADGATRAQGFVVLLGREIESIGLASRAGERAH
jgi:hypothetical protein